MTILTKPYMQTGNAKLLPVDRNDPSLVLYLPFYYQYGDLTGDTLYSYDINRYACTNSNTSWSKDGRLFTAATPSYMTIPDTATKLDFTSSDFTIIAQVKMTAVATLQMIFWKCTWESNGYYVWILDDGSFVLRTVSAAGHLEATTGASEIAASTWYTIGVSRVAAAATFYKNGSVVSSSGSCRNPIASAAVESVIGTWGNHSNNPLGGTVRFLGIWNRALSAGEHAIVAQGLNL